MTETRLAEILKEIETEKETNQNRVQETGTWESRFEDWWSKQNE